MTSLDKVERATVAPPASAAVPGRHLAIELAETLKLAVPLALTQLGQIAMMTTDLAFIGRFGSETVAAAALAHTVFFVTFTFGMGLVSAVAPLAAQAFGARDPRMVRRALRVGLWAALLIALPLMALPFRGEAILIALGQAPAAAKLAQQYLFGLAWGILPALWFIAIRGFMSAVNRPEPVLWITLAAIPANALLVYLLLYGKWGLPELGLFGAGLATSMVNLGTFLAGLWFTALRRPFRKYHVLGNIWRIDWPLMAQARDRRRADLDGVSAGIRAVRRRRPADGPDQHHSTRSAPDCAPDRSHPFHGAVRNQHGSNRPGRSCGRAPRRRRRQARRLRGDTVSALRSWPR